MNRPCHLAGSFYPATKRELELSLQDFLDEVGQVEKKVAPLMILLPHAGHIYCGNVVAATLTRVNLMHRIIILAPSHTGRGKALGVWQGGAWETPLGEVPVDEALAKKLCAYGGFEPDTLCHMGEHSIEVLLPWVQSMRPDCTIVPVTVSAQGQELVLAAEALAALLAEEAKGGNSVTLIVSSDMNHFATEEENFRRDEEALKPLLALDAKALYETVLGRRISMCGIMPATLALLACKSLGASRAELVAHTSSAAITGDPSRVVGYAGVIID